MRNQRDELVVGNVTESPPNNPMDLLKRDPRRMHWANGNAIIRISIHKEDQYNEISATAQGYDK